MMSAMRPSRFARAGVLILVDEPADARPWQVALDETGEFLCDVKTPAEIQESTPDNLSAGYKVVCLLSVARPSADLWNKLHAFVFRGGGLAVVPGGAELDRTAYRDVAAQQLLPGKLVDIITVPDPGSPWPQAASRHPLLIPFQRWRNEEVDFQQPERRPRATRYWQVQANSDKSVVVRYSDDKERPALLERAVHEGRVLLFTTALDGRHLAPGQRWNNYWQESSFGLVLANLAVSYLAGNTAQAGFNHLVGDPVAVRVAPAPFYPIYTLHGPGSPDGKVTIPRSREQDRLVITRTTLPGNYTVLDGDQHPVAGFSLNVPAEECQLRRVPVDEIERVLGLNSVHTSEEDVTMRDVAPSALRVELLPWFMILLILLLAVESLLANRFHRRAAAAPTAGVNPAARGVFS